MPFSVGGNLLSAALVVVIFSIFVIALIQTHHIYTERCDRFQHFNFALEMAEQLRDRVLVEGASTSLKNWLDVRDKALAREGLKFRVEIRDLQGKLLFKYGQEPDFFTSHFSPPVGASLPIVFYQNESFGEPCEAVVRVWRV
jgi:hypothetical protein